MLIHSEASRTGSRVAGGGVSQFVGATREAEGGCARSRKSPPQAAFR